MATPDPPLDDPEPDPLPDPEPDPDPEPEPDPEPLPPEEAPPSGGVAPPPPPPPPQAARASANAATPSHFEVLTRDLSFMTITLPGEGRALGKDAGGSGTVVSGADTTSHV